MKTHVSQKRGDLETMTEVEDLREARKEILHQCRRAARANRPYDTHLYAYAYNVLCEDGDSAFFGRDEGEEAY